MNRLFTLYHTILSNPLYLSAVLIMLLLSLIGLITLLLEMALYVILPLSGYYLYLEQTNQEIPESLNAFKERLSGFSSMLKNQFLSRMGFIA
ncbi:MAG: hypothetical protein HQL50_00345 [Magnetococcales bacterium]|nr:hypothetical protein [Magnetococcales bacterium]